MAALGPVAILGKTLSPGVPHLPVPRVLMPAEVRTLRNAYVQPWGISARFRFTISKHIQSSGFAWMVFRLDLDLKPILFGFDGSMTGHGFAP
jgi:hypothetical protein